MTLSSISELDAALSKKIRVAEKPGRLRSIAVFFGHSGDSWFWFIGLFLLFIFGSGFWRLRALVMFAAIIGTALLVLAIKFTIRRERPEGDWGQIYRKADPHSFPSGHAARGLLLGVIAIGMGPAWFGWLLALWGPLVGLARVAMGVHYLSDIIAGWILGVIMGIISLQMYPSLF